MKKVSTADNIAFLDFQKPAQKSKKQYFRYWSICLATGIARLIPLRLGYFLAERGGDIFYLFSKQRRDNIGKNIQRAMDQKEDPETLRRQVRQVFRNSAKNYFDVIKMPQMDKENLDGRVRIEGIEHLTEAVNRKKGVIIASAHLGNFEYSAHVMAARGFDMTALIEAYDNSTPFLRKIASLRKGKGVRIVPADATGIKECLKALLRGQIVSIICDRDLQGNGIQIPFLGLETSFPTGVVDLALRTGAAVVPIFSLRGPRNTTSIFIEPALKLVDQEERDQAVRAGLKVLVAVIEKYIRQYPEQWVVLEKI